MATGLSQDDPLVEINTTPLIDVLLVLIIMLIITIPLQSHAVKVDVPPPVPREIIDPVRNVVGVGRTGELLWNGAEVDRAELSALMAYAANLPSDPETQLKPDPRAPYGIVDEVLVLARKAKVERLGFVGNEAYQRF